MAATDPSTAPRLYKPAWLGSALYAAVIAALIAYAVWPGLMSYDSLYAYEEGLYGIQTMLWPPLHAYMFTVSNAVGAGAGGVLVFQLFVLFFAGALILFSLIRRRWVAAGLCAGFMLSFPYIPPQLGTLLAQWRDVPTASFTLLGLALWLQGARTGSRLFLVGAVVAFGLAVALRYNAIVLVLPLLALMAWRPRLAPGPGAVDRALVVISLVVVLGAAWASTQWRLPDLVRIPPAGNFGGAQQFDVFGVSACAGRNYMPAVVSGGVPLTPAQLRSIYDPRHLQSILAPHPGIPRLLETDAGGAMASTWRFLLTHETGCYLQHRTLVLIEQLGMADHAPFYSNHDGIDPNRFGLVLARPAVAQGVKAYVERNAVEAWRRPYLLYLGAVVAAALAAAVRRDRARLMLAMLAGVFAYPALLFLAAPAADARYIFPSNTLASLMMLIAAGFLIERVLDARSRASGAGP